MKTDNEDFVSLKPAFVGGAERARRNARKRRHLPRSESSSSISITKKRRHNVNHSMLPYPKSMREYDRFFGSLLSSSTAALQKSESDGSSHQAVIQLACSLLNVPSLPTPSYLLQKMTSSGSNDARTHHLLQRSCSLLSNVSGESMVPNPGSYDSARRENIL
jgi:hypothetical protein